MDLYGPVLEKWLFPAMEAARGRPTLPVLQFLRGSEHWSLDALRELQASLLCRLMRHAARHTAHYRALLADRGIAAEDIATVHDLRRLPVLERDAAPGTIDARTATDGGSRAAHEAESRAWREAMRWRGHGWVGYRVGM